MVVTDGASCGNNGLSGWGLSGTRDDFTELACPAQEDKAEGYIGCRFTALTSHWPISTRAVYDVDGAH